MTFPLGLISCRGSISDLKMKIVTNSILLLLCASILGAALIVVYLPRYEIFPRSDGLIYFHDKWTGKVELCGNVNGINGKGIQFCWAYTNSNASSYP